MIFYLSKRELKHTRGDAINCLSSKQSLTGSNNGDEHFVENIGNEPAVVYVVAAAAVGLPTTTNY